MDHNAYNEYLVRKLAHYNKWLLDTKREFGKPYPGFPEELQLAKKGKKMESPVIANMAKTMTKAAAPAKAVKAKKAKRVGASPTKGDLALQVYKRLNGDKTNVISELQTGLGMSLAGATTYFYNAKKAAASE
jgi:hypothetical protein